jgi:anti-sigma-K factor RskA
LNINDYISSGILELYVTGELSPAERAEVEAMAAKHPEIRTELEAIEIAMEKYALMHAVEPPKNTLDAILNAVNTESKTEEKGKIVTMQPKSGGNTLRYLAYAASILLFLSVGTNIYYFNKYTTVKDELADIRQDNTFMAGEMETLKANYNKMEAEYNVVLNPDFIAITMKGLPISPSATSIVYWNKEDGTVYVNANNLPAPEQGKQYQLWALKGGQPVNAGMIDMNGKIQFMENISAADAFAVTLEPAGGSPSPTLELLYVIGNV